MNDIQKEVLLDRLFEPHNLPALRKIISSSLSKKPDPYTQDNIYCLQIRISRREIEKFQMIDIEADILYHYIDNIKDQVGGI